MSKVTMPKRSSSQWRPVLLCLQITALAAGIIILDQITKAWARGALVDRDIQWFGLSWARFSLTFNTGAGFGLDLGTRFPFVIIGAVAIGALFYLRWDKLASGWERLFLALATGGIVGNLIDRVVDGRVTDFVSISVWPVFNIADAALVVGVFWFSWGEWTRMNKEKKAMSNEQCKNLISVN